MDGILYHEATDKHTRRRYVVPYQLRQTLLRAHHDCELASHVERDKSYESIVTKYYWSGLCVDVQNRIKGCKQCAIFKPNKPVLLRPIETHQKPQSNTSNFARQQSTTHNQNNVHHRSNTHHSSKKLNRNQKINHVKTQYKQPIKVHSNPKLQIFPTYSEECEYEERKVKIQEQYGPPIPHHLRPTKNLILYGPVRPPIPTKNLIPYGPVWPPIPVEINRSNQSTHTIERPTVRRIGTNHFHGSVKHYKKYQRSVDHTLTLEASAAYVMRMLNTVAVLEQPWFRLIVIVKIVIVFVEVIIVIAVVKITFFCVPMSLDC